ncbi:MAG: hypothetical protein ACE5JR_10065 [Gemmatimonadota bacterium]
MERQTGRSPACSAAEVGKLLLLLGPKARSVLRRGSAGERRALRMLLLLAVGAAAWSLIYLAIFRFLRNLRHVPDVGPLLASKLLALGFLVFLGILLLSNLIAALSSFFLSRDLPAIIAAPVDWLAVYLARLTETVVSSSWMVLLMLAPILAAYEQVYGGGPVFYGLAAIAIAPFLVIPAAVGSASTLLLVRVFPARRTRDLLGLVTLAAAAFLVLGLRVIRPERLVRPEEFRNLVDFLAVLRGPSSPWLPSQWAADSLSGFLQGGLDPFFLLLLWSTAGGVVVLGAALHGRLFPVCFTRAQEGAENRLVRTLGWRALERLGAPLRMELRELMLKDVRLFFRDTTQWSQLIILAVLIVVYVYNIHVLPVRSSEAIGRYLVALVGFLNLALTGFVLAAVAARFVFPAISLEGRTLWLLRSSPTEAATILRSKFWVGVVPLALLAFVLTAVTDVLLGVRPGMLVLSVASVVGLSFAFTGQALAWGSAYPEFEMENAAQIPTSVGGLLFMLGALATLAAVVGGQLWALRGYLVSGLPGRVARDPLAAEVAAALAITLGVCALVTVLPFRAAVRRLGEIAR